MKEKAINQIVTQYKCTESQITEILKDKDVKKNLQLLENYEKLKMKHMTEMLYNLLLDTVSCIIKTQSN